MGLTQNFKIHFRNDGFLHAILRFALVQSRVLSSDLFERQQWSFA